MRVFVAGASGAIGRPLVAQLMAAGDAVALFGLMLRTFHILAEKEPQF